MKFTRKTWLAALASLLALFWAMNYWDMLAAGASVLYSAVRPVAFGAAAAYIINILMSFFERKLAPGCNKPLWMRYRRICCVMLSFFTLIAAGAILVYAIVPQLKECLKLLADALPGAVTSAYNWLETTFGVSEFLQGSPLALPATSEEWQSLIGQWAEVLISGVGGVMNAAVSVTSSVIGIVVTVAVGLILSFKFVCHKEQLKSQLIRLSRKAMGEKLLRRFIHVLSVLNDCFHSYISGQLIEAFILGVLCTVGMLIFRFPYAFMIGALVGVMALIPIAGAYIAAAVGAVMISSQSPVQALWFLVFLVVLQQIEGNFIYPKTVGSKLNLPAMWVLAAVTVGSGVMGILGMIVFVPITAAVYRLLGEWVRGVSDVMPEHS